MPGTDDQDSFRIPSVQTNICGDFCHEGKLPLDKSHYISGFLDFLYKCAHRPSLDFGTALAPSPRLLPNVSTARNVALPSGSILTANARPKNVESVQTKGALPIVRRPKKGSAPTRKRSLTINHSLVSSSLSSASPPAPNWPSSAPRPHSHGLPAARGRRGTPPRRRTAAPW